MKEFSLPPLSCDRRKSSVRLGDRDLFAEVNVLDGIEELNPVLHRALERLATRNQVHAARSLIDHRRERGVREVMRAACPARIDQARTTEVTIRHLVAAQVDRMFAGQLGVDTFVELAVARTAGVQSLIAAMVLRKFLPDDVGLDRAAEVVRRPVRSAER
jgi:hypothetical protein